MKQTRKLSARKLTPLDALAFANFRGTARLRTFAEDMKSYLHNPSQNWWENEASMQLKTLRLLGFVLAPKPAPSKRRVK